MAAAYLWGTTHCPGARIRIWVDPELEGCVGEAHWRHGVAAIRIHPKALKLKRRLAALLIHEFTHIVEYLNDPGHLSPVVEDQCTALAQTMEVMMTPLIMNLKVKKGKSPFK